MAYLLRSGEKRKEADYTGEDEERALMQKICVPLSCVSPSTWASLAARFLLPRGFGW